MQAKGEFEVKRIPQEELDIGEGATVGHSRFDKRFHGPLDATSVVHMLAVMSAVPGSGAYVAMVPDTGTGDLTGLHGRIAIDIVDGKHSYTFDYDFRE